MPKLVSNALTTRFVESIRREGIHLDGRGLYLCVTRSSAVDASPSTPLSKSWLLRYKFAGKVREIGLGSLRDVSLAKARTKAQECREQLADGVDPLLARDQRRKQSALQAATAISFEKCAERYIATHASSWKSAKHAEQWTNTIDTYCKPFLKLPVQSVDVPLVLKALEPIWEDKAETATRVRARIERILDWAKVRGYRDGENPARWKGHLDKLLPNVEKRKRVRHHPALPYPEIAAFIESLKKQDGGAARALEFTILTAARTGEVIGARWDEIDLALGIWSVPKERMKAHREHRVPLSPQAIKLLKAIDRDGELVFPISNMAMLALLERMERDDITVHGFRSSFRDWAAEQTNYAREVAEAALAHVISDAVEAGYRRGDLFEKRRRMMDDWGRYCASRPAKGSAKVLKLRA